MTGRIIIALALLLLLFNQKSTASDSLKVLVNNTKLSPGDTLKFEGICHAWKGTRKTGTLNLWMEDRSRTYKWRFRYPVIDGLAYGEIAIPKETPADYYACYFSLQDNFFSMTGKVQSYYRDTAVRVVVMLEDKELMAENIKLNNEKEFRVGKLLFADKARFFFGPVKHKAANDLDIDVAVSLDSSFTALHDTTVMLTVGIADTSSLNTYTFNPKKFVADDEGTLPGVEVVAKKKTPIDKFEEERVSALFKGGDALVFDASENNQFAGFYNILEWLRGRVAGLTITPSGNGFDYSVKWRGSNTFLYVDEIEVDAETFISIPTTDVAYIKVFQPPFFGGYLGGAGGAIAIYTKNGSEGPGYGPKHTFIANGYTPETTTLQLRTTAAK